MALIESYRSEEVRLLLLVRLPGLELSCRIELEGRTESDEGIVLSGVLFLLFRRVRHVEGGEAGAIGLFRRSGTRFNCKV